MPKYPLRDLIVVLPGITGSVLTRSDASDKSADLWNISGGALWQYLTSRGNSLADLAVPRHDPRTDTPDGPIAATELISGFHGVFGLVKIDGYESLCSRLVDEFQAVRGQNFIEFPYDWRLSNRVSAARLGEVIKEKLRAWRDHTDEPDAKVIFVAHSMGGLVARYWLEVLEGWPDCRALLTLGTPYRGSLDAVGYVANGYKKAFVDLSEVLRTCPSVYELMPVYESIKYGRDWLRPSEVAVPKSDAQYVEAAAAFHAAIETAVSEHRTNPDYLKSYVTVPFVGVHQTTWQSAHLSGALTLSRDSPSWFEDDVAGGDGTVPRVSATPIEMESGFGSTFLGEQHGSLQNNPYVLDDIVERIRQSQTRNLGAIRGVYVPRTRSIDVVVDDLVLQGEPVVIRARAMTDGGPDPRIGLKAELLATSGTSVGPTTVDLAEGDEYARAVIEGLTAGRYRVTVRTDDPTAAAPLPVHAVFECAG